MGKACRHVTDANTTLMSSSAYRPVTGSSSFRGGF